MKRVETTSETGAAPPMPHVPVTPRPRRRLRAVLIRLLEAWLARLRTSGPAPVVLLLPAPIVRSAQTVLDQHDPVSVPARSAWQWLGVIVVLVLAVAAAWGAWRKMETLEQRHEEAVSMTLAAVEQDLADQRANLGTIRDHVTNLAAQVATPNTAVVDVSPELRALKQQVEELAMTIGAYGAILGKQQHEVAAHTEQLTTQDATLRALASAPRPAPTTIATKTRPRSTQNTPPVSATEVDVAATRDGRPLITLPANLGAWSLGVRNSDR